MLISRQGVLFLTVAFVLSASAAWPRNASPALPAALTSAQIVSEMQRHNQARANELKHYQSMRHYQAEYEGFSLKLTAGMDVEVRYDAKSGKSFRIVKEHGSKVLLDKVLKRAVDSEMEAQKEKKSTALTPANYSFHLAGSENLDGREAYVLDVEPLVASKFLFKGKIWVDAEEFALVKIEVKPAKNPSFWITHTQILETFAKTGNSWLPERNRSETKVRIGGTAVFMIDYGTYQMESNASYSHQSPPQGGVSVDPVETAKSSW